MTVKTKKIILAGLPFLIISLFLIPQLVFAQASVGLEMAADTGLGTTDLKELIVRIIQIFLGFLGIIAVIVILYGGFVWLTAGGEADKVSSAKKILINGVIGLVVILLAFSIVTYIINWMSEATGPGIEACDSPGQIEQCSTVGNCERERECQANNQWGGCYITNLPCDQNFDPNGSFGARAIVPQGQLNIRNAVVQVTFNRNVEPEGVINPPDGFPQSIKVLKILDNGQFEETGGNLTLAADRLVTFTPEAECPGHPEVYCFDANQAYQIQISDTEGVSLVSVDGQTVDCGFSPCQAEFTTGNVIDATPPDPVNLTRVIGNPTVNLYNGVNLSADELYELYAYAEDDGGLGQIDFYLADGYLDTATPLPPPPLSYEGSVYWDTASYQTNQTYTLRARAYDLAGHDAWSEPIEIIIRPSHCFDGRINSNLGETGLDCGGECPACEGASCSTDPLNCVPNNYACLSRICDNNTCLCVPLPEITAIDPDNGAAGNWVTIFGKNFGAQPGEVWLMDPRGNFLRARLPNVQGCENTWQDNQIIVEIPQAVRGVGVIRWHVVTDQNLASKSFEDFTLDPNAVYPGVCGINPDAGVFESEFTVLGTQFGAGDDRSVYFGDQPGQNPALNPVWQIVGNHDEVTALVPNLVPGRLPVRVAVGENSSNGVYFTVLGEQQEQLRINYFEPVTGAPGQYITIYGSGFGPTKTDTGTVRFLTSAGYAEGNFEFPQQCGTNFWSSDQIIVKVPFIPPDEVIENGAPLVVFKDGEQAISGDNFVYNEDLGVAPGICSINPEQGSVGAMVEIAGEPFNGATVNFSNVDGLNPEEGGNNNLIYITVPPGAQSGRITVVNNDLESNPVNFEVIAAVEDLDEENYDYYEWQFTTCWNCLIPEVVERGNCLGGNASPLPLRYPLENHDKALLDQNLAFAFNVSIDPATLIPGAGENATIKMQSCSNRGEDRDTPGVCGNFFESLSGPITSNEDLTYFIFNPGGDVPGSQVSAYNMWYKVTLTTGITSLVENPADPENPERIPLAEDYSWYFKAISNNDPGECIADQVNITPANRTQGSNQGPILRGETVSYRSYGVNSGNCAICPDVFDWDWSSDNANARLQDQDDPDNSSNWLYASGLVMEPETANISAAISDVPPNPAAQAPLNIVPPDPRIVMDYSCNNGTNRSPTPWPNEQGVCVNAMVYARFNIMMDAATLTTANVRLYKCSGGDCNDFVAEDNNQLVPQGTDETIEFIYIPGASLEPDTWFEVRLSSDVLSIDGVNLTGLRSWQFKTRADATWCEFNAIAVNPGNHTLMPEQSYDYTAVGYNAASCQLLTAPDETVWQWSSETDIDAEPPYPYAGQNIASVLPVTITGNAGQTTATANESGTVYIRSAVEDEGNFVFNSGDNGRLMVGAPPVLTLVNYQPTDNEVCLNALARAGFNFSLDEASINDDNFTVIYYDDEGNPADVSAIITYNDSRQVVSLRPDLENYLWLADKDYTVAIKGAADGVSSGELRLEQNGCTGTWNAEQQACFWTFTTVDEMCAVSSVGVSPTSSVKLVGEEQAWQGTAYDEFNLALSNPVGAWSLSNGNVATITEVIVPDQSVTAGTAPGITWVEATVENITSAGELTVEPELMGPNVLDVLPDDRASNICRNALVSLEFDQYLNEQTVNDEIFSLSYYTETLPDGGGCEQIVQASQLQLEGGNLIFRTLLARFFNDLMPGLFNSLFDKIFGSAYAADNDNNGNANINSNDGGYDINLLDNGFLQLPQEGFWCPLAGIGNWTVSNISGTAKVNYQLTEPLPATKIIRVKVLGGDNGVLGTTGLGLKNHNNGADYTYYFSTGADVCELDFVSVTVDESTGDKEWLFTTSHDDSGDNSYGSEGYDQADDFDKVYQVIGYSSTPVGSQPLVSIAGVYEWDWQWSSQDTGIALTADCPNFEDYYPDCGDFINDYSVVLAANNNGESNITAQAVFPPWQGKDNLADSGLAKVELCENPWPSYNQNHELRYYDDNDKNTGYKFALFYCRDAGGYGTLDDLPSIYSGADLSRVAGDGWVVTTDDGDPYDGIADDLLEEYLIPVPVTDDIIGIRIYSNYYHLSPSGWYAKNIPADQQGNLDSFEVDGYPAIQDGRTVYVAAANLTLDGGGNVTRAYTNIFLISYNSGASQPTIDIFNRLVDRLEFNTNVSDNQVKEAVNKDLQRMMDLAGIESSLYEYSLSHQEQILNNDFEQGLNSWEIENGAQAAVNNDPAGVRHGNRSLHITADEEDKGIYQELILAPATNYDMSAWVYIESGRVALTFSGTDHNEWISPGNFTGWYNLRNVLQTTSSPVGANSYINKMHIRSYNGAAEFYVDSVILRSNYPALAAGSFLPGMSTSKWPSWNQTLGPTLGANLPFDPINNFNGCIACEADIFNNGFEYDLFDWTAVGAADSTVNQDAAYVKSGEKSLRVQSGSIDSGVRQQVSLAAGSLYNFSAWIYVSSGQVQLRYGNDVMVATPAEHQGWYQLQTEINTNYQLADGAVSILTFGDGQDNIFYADDIALTPQDGACGYDPQTCWNPSANNEQGAFACDAASYFYRYQYRLNQEGGLTFGIPNYFLSAKMEMPYASAVAEVWQPQNGSGYVFFNTDNLSLSSLMVEGCDQTVIGQACGNGVVEPPIEECEPGQHHNWCPVGYNWQTPQILGCDDDCQWLEPAGQYPNYCGGYCGNGLVDAATEGCDPSAPIGSQGFGAGISSTNQYDCSVACQDFGGYCGNNTVEFNYGEQCDGAAGLGSWDCLSGNPACRPVNHLERCQVYCPAGGEPYAGRCGNNTIDQGEQCDGTARPPHTICSDSCQITGCENGWDDCDGSMADNDGCEINIGADPQNCQSCGTSCFTGLDPQYLDNTIVACDGDCAYSCNPYNHYLNCQNPPADCETNYYTDPENCGYCGGNCINSLVRIDNNSFETGSLSPNWVAYGNPSTLATSSQQVHDGEFSAHVVANSTSQGIQQYVIYESETTYDLSAWVYIISGQVALSFWGTDLLPQAERISNIHNQWIQLENRLSTTNIPRGANGYGNGGAGLVIYSSGGPAEFYVDEIRHTGPGQTAITCSDGDCSYACIQPPWVDCGGNGACESNLQTSATDCGRCDNVCPPPNEHGYAICNGGSCDVVCDQYYIKEGVQCVEFCGDGVVIGDEFCDEGNNNGVELHCNADCSGFRLWDEAGNLIFHDNFNDNTVLPVPEYNNWLVRNPGIAPHADWSIVDLKEEGNPYTLQGQVSEDCLGSDNYFIKALAQNNINQSSLVILTRIQVRGNNPTALILANYNIDGDDNYDTESGYALWANFQENPLALIRYTRMNTNIRDAGAATIPARVTGEKIPADEWYWIALLVENDGNRAIIKGTYWPNGAAIPALDEWHLNYTDNTPLAGTNFALATWGECGTGWFDDFQVYEFNGN